MSEEGVDLAAAVREVARSVRARIAELPPDRRAEPALRQDGELHPWTALAEDVFGGTDPYDGPDDRLRHHRAVCLHTRAYDLQRAGEPARALPYWRAALREWAALHGSDAFWEAVQQRLPPVDGRAVPSDVVAAARRALPGQLLDVHVSLARSLRPSDRMLAAAHAVLVRESGFPADAVAAARSALFAGLDAQVAEALEHKRFGPLFDEVVEWLEIDPTAAEPAHLLVALANGWAWRLWQQDDGWTKVGNMLRRVEEALPPGEAEHPLADGDEARLAYWRGVHLRYSTGLPRIGDRASELARIRRANQRAEQHLRAAMGLSPDVRLHPWLIHHQLAEPISVQAVCAHMEGRDDDARGLAEQAVQLDAGCTRASELLATLGPAVTAVPEPAAEPERAPLGGNPSVLVAMMADNEVRALDRFLDRDEQGYALDHLEHLERSRTDPANRRELAAHPAVARLGALVQLHPTRRRRFHQVLAKLGGPDARGEDAG